MTKNKIMTKNMGESDRMNRTIVAAVFGILFCSNFGSGALGIIFLVIAGIFFLTSFIRFCPLYFHIGIKTCSIIEKK